MNRRDDSAPAFARREQPDETYRIPAHSNEPVILSQIRASVQGNTPRWIEPWLP